MLEFLYLVLFRWLSGAQNGLGYARRPRARLAASVLMGLILVATAAKFFIGTNQASIAACILTAVSLTGTIGVEDAFNEGFDIFPKDIHLFEILATGGITLAWVVAGGNIITIAAATYPGLIVHKGLINIFSGLPFWYHGTDDDTGRTFSIPLLNIKVPRLSQQGRIILAIVSLVVGVAAPSVVGHITLYSILHLVGANL